MTEIKITNLRDLCTSAVLKMRVSPQHADIIIDHYLENELSGKTSHGMVRIVELSKVLEKFDLPSASINIEKDNSNSLILNGNNNFGPVIGMRLVQEVIERAQKHDITFVGAHSYIANTGSMAYYLRRLADAGLIGIISCSSVPIVAAPAGKDRLLGTNPIGLGVPSSDGNHFIADFATSAIAYGKVLVALDQGEEIPEGCLIDKNGNPSTNPKDAQGHGAILPLADYRGFSLGLFVEMLGMLVGGQVFKEDWFGKDGLFIIAINPNNLNNNYKNQVEDILNHIRHSNPAPGHDSVSIPGDRSLQKLNNNIKKGSVNVADKTLEKIRRLT